MNTDAFIHETTYSPCNSKGEPDGDIDLRITYVVNSYGRPARIHWDENDHPEEFPEVDIVHVEMLNAPKSGAKPVYIDTWNWLYDWAGDWASENAGDLAAKARLEARSA